MKAEGLTTLKGKLVHAHACVHAHTLKSEEPKVKDQCRSVKKTIADF